MPRTRGSQKRIEGSIISLATSPIAPSEDLKRELKASSAAGPSTSGLLRGSQKRIEGSLTKSRSHLIVVSARGSQKRIEGVRDNPWLAILARRNGEDLKRELKALSLDCLNQFCLPFGSRISKEN